MKTTKALVSGRNPDTSIKSLYPIPPPVLPGSGTRVSLRFSAMNQAPRWYSEVTKRQQ
jgi:hypothetical protein